MPPVRRRPIYFRFKSFTPANRRQQERIRIPQPKHRPVRVWTHDGIKRELAREPSPDWYTLHRKGIRRPRVGIPINEQRAVSESVVRGTLPERIMYLELIKRHWVPGLDFDFQSSQEGGRGELGGIVVDFLFRDWRIALRVQGYTHQRVIQVKKDEEQQQTLASYGFDVVDIQVKTVLNAAATEQWFRKKMDWRSFVRQHPETFLAPFEDVS